jgi:CRP-like cAMP-binding protein
MLLDSDEFRLAWKQEQINMDIRHKEESGKAKIKHNKNRRQSQAIPKAKHGVYEHMDLSAAIDAVEIEHKVFHPQSKFCNRWDGFVCIALLFTACITPFEIAMLETSMNELFFLNRVMDCIFAFDIYVSMKLAFFNQSTGNWVMNPSKCAKRYLKGWFSLDVVSLIPWDVIAYVIEQQAAGKSAGADGGGGDVGNLRILRLLKILKITKLARIIKAAKVFKELATYLMLSSTTKQLVKYLFMIGLCMHWIACAWGFLPTISGAMDIPTYLDGSNATDAGGRRRLKGGGGGDAAGSSEHPAWIRRVEEDRGEFMPISDIYALCLEYSLTIMCMGYGTVEPNTSSERWFSICCLLSAGSLYAYVVGGICAAVASEDPAVVQYKENMDMLMTFLEQHRMPNHLRIRAYEYFEFCKQLLRDKCHIQVLEYMAPSLRAEIASQIHGKWIHTVPFLNPSEQRERSELMKNICTNLTPEAFPPDETLYIVGEVCSEMYIVQRGLLASLAPGDLKMLNFGTFFGAEALSHFLTSRPAKRTSTVKTLSYVNVEKFNAHDLLEIVTSKPATFRETFLMIRKAAVKHLMFEMVRKLGHMVVAMLKVTNKRRTKIQLAHQKELYEAKAKLKHRFALERAQHESAAAEEIVVSKEYIQAQKVQESVLMLRAHLENMTSTTLDSLLFEERYGTKPHAPPAKKNYSPPLANKRKKPVGLTDT